VEVGFVKEMVHMSDIDFVKMYKKVMLHSVASTPVEVMCFKSN
jgi:hypothetical protein